MRIQLPLFAFIVLALAAQAEVDVVQPNELTIILDIASAHSAEAIKEMQRELTTVMRDAPYALSFRRLKDIREGEEFREVVVVRLRGVCEMEPRRSDRWAANGALAFAHSSEGEILPFAEISCDAVRGSVRSALRGPQLWRANLLFGRALGRVLAHELYHVCARTAKHGTGGIAKTTLSGEQLIADTLEFDPDDLVRMKKPEPMPAAAGGGI
jgi:hypothetical protein